MALAAHKRVVPEQRAESWFLLKKCCFRTEVWEGANLWGPYQVQVSAKRRDA